MPYTGRSVIGISSIGTHPSLPIAGGIVSAADGFNFQIAGVPPAITGLIAWAAPSPFSNVPNDAVAVMTDVGRTAINRMPVEQFRLGNFSFAVGTGGYDPADPTQATVPNPLDVALSNQVFPAAPGTYELCDRIERPNATSIAFLCRVETAEALFALGEIGIFAQILESPIPAEIGTWIMFGLAHFPIQAKSSKGVLGYRVVMQQP